MYKPSRIAEYFNSIHRNCTFAYPFKRARGSLSRTGNFCQYMRWTTYGVIKWIVGILFTVSVAVGIIFGTMIAMEMWYNVFTLSYISPNETVGLQMFDAFGAHILQEAKDYSFPVAVVAAFWLLGMFVATSFSGLLLVGGPILAFVCGVLWGCGFLFVKIRERFANNGSKVAISIPSYKQTAVYNAIVRVKDKFCPSVDYTDIDKV